MPYGLRVMAAFAGRNRGEEFGDGLAQVTQRLTAGGGCFTYPGIGGRHGVSGYSGA